MILILYVILSILVLFTLVVFLYTRQAQFGRKPSGERLKRVKQSPNYRDGKFQNVNLTPSLTEGYSFGKVFYEFIFKKVPGRNPLDLIPTQKTDLLNLPPDEDILVWFGHSSYFLQLNGKRILVDPVFSGNASPVPRSNKAFKGADQYTVADLPVIDYLFITHDHYDHLDYHTSLQLISKTDAVICGLGVGGHLERWGFPQEKIIEKDWNETFQLDGDLTVHTTTSRHFSGRRFKRNNTLWMSFVLEAPALKLFLGGDSGYDTHFAEIGEKYGPFDLAILENGQYDAKWKYIHLLPEEVLVAGKDLKAKRVLPVHSSKFALAQHAWNEPLVRLTVSNETLKIPLVTPVIGEKVNLRDENQAFSQWWTNIR